MILLHKIDGRAIIIPVKTIAFVEEVEGGSKIDTIDVFNAYSQIDVKEHASEILLKINQNK